MLQENFCANCGSEVNAKTCRYCGHVYKSKKTTWKRIITSLKDKSWYQHPFWVTVIGSIFLITGQMTAAYLAIYTSNEASDFGISIDPIYYEAYKSETNHIFFKEDFYNNSRLSKPYTGESVGFGAWINISNVHRVIKPYTHNVFVNASDRLPKGIKIDIDNPDGIPPFKTPIFITITNQTDEGNYPITIQARGGDGRIRSCQCIIRIAGYEDIHPAP